jgi:hypothetical protein
MRKAAHYILFVLIGISCGNIRRETDLPVNKSYHLKRMAYEILDTTATVCISQNQIEIKTGFKNHVEWDLGGENVTYARYFRAQNDTVIQDSIRELNNGQLLMPPLETKDPRSCFDTLETYSFKYDNTFPVKLNRARTDYIDITRNTEKLSVCVSYDMTKAETILYTYLEGELDSIQVAGARTDVDFFLADITEDGMPEIFLIKHFIMPSVTAGDTPMIELEIYQVDLKNK